MTEDGWLERRKRGEKTHLQEQMLRARIQEKKKKLYFLCERCSAKVCRMSVVLCLVAALLFPARPGLTSPLTELSSCEDRLKSRCSMCPPGEFRPNCGAECSLCPEGFYSSGRKCAFMCQPCFRDCRPELGLKVEAACTRTADVRCCCEAGFSCSSVDQNTGICNECSRNPGSILGNPSEKTTASSGSCRHPNCSARDSILAVIPAGCNATKRTTLHTAEGASSLVVVVCPIVAVGIVALVLLFCIRRRGDEACFKRVLKLCNEGVKDGSLHKPAGQQHTGTATGSSQQGGPQPPPLVTANLGPVHVHSAGTVIFSLLNHFTGQGEVAEEGVKRGQKERDEEEVTGFQTHPTPSPPAHLSQEERDGESDCVFFPSQEQGKDCHMSKEEALRMREES